MSSWGSDLLQGAIAGNQIASPIADAMRFKAQQAMEQKRMDQSADFQRQSMGIHASQLDLQRQRARNEALNDWAKTKAIDVNGQVDPRTYGLTLRWAQANGWNPLDGAEPDFSAPQPKKVGVQDLPPETQNSLANTKVSMKDPNSGMQVSTTGDHAMTLLQDPNIGPFLNKAGEQSKQSQIPQAQALPQNVVPQQTVNDLGSSLEQRLAQRDAQKQELYNLAKQGQISQMEYNKAIQGMQLEDKQAIMEKRKSDAAIADQASQDARLIAAITAKQAMGGAATPNFTNEELKGMNLSDMISKLPAVLPKATKAGEGGGSAGGGAEKNLNENQSKNYLALQGMNAVNGDIEKSLRKYDPTNPITGDLPALDRFKTKDRKYYENTKAKWIESFLRSTTGASYNNYERGDVERMFFPTPGDSREETGRKAKLRQTMMNAISQTLPSKFQNSGGDIILPEDNQQESYIDSVLQ